MKNKSKKIASAGFLAIIIIAAGGLFFLNQKNAPIAEAPKNEEVRIETYSKNPLTGLPIDDDKVNARPIAIMINNLHSGQPLLGVTDADIMYECPTEGGITRILGVFKDPFSVPAIGSVRSSRPYFISIAKSLDAIYVHLGGSTHAYSILHSGYIDSIDLIKGQFMWRDPARRKNLGLEHSALTSGKKLGEGIKANGFRTQWGNDYTYPQSFGGDSQVLGGTSATKITAKFSGYKSTVFTYDEPTQTYLISQFNRPQMDDNIKRQNSKPNIILMNVSGQNIDNTELLALDIIGRGTGKYISHGKSIDITWARNTDTSPFSYFTSDGKPLTMLPGKIYTCLLAQWARADIA